MIYNFQKGQTAEFMLNKLRSRFTSESDFVLDKLTNVPFEKIQLKNNAYVYSHGEHEHYMFAYKHRFATERYSTLPKYHISECQTRETYTGFRFSHQMPVNIYCIDQRKSLGAKTLELCKNCIKEVNFFSFGDKDIEWFEVILKKADQREYSDEDLRLDGYTRDWNHVSKAYRTKMNYTCEKCRINLKERRTEFFCETHHIDHNKANNNTENLQCLCVKCHSEVDNIHTHNYSSGRNLEKLSAFELHFDR